MATWLVTILATTQLLFAADDFTVKQVKGRAAVLEGSAKGLKVGDMLYFARSPFKFTVAAVKGNLVTITLPEKNDLAVGNAVLRTPTEQIKKSLETQSRLKQALEE